MRLWYNLLEEMVIFMNFKAIIFDLDGTLLNTLGDLNASTNYALEKYGYDSVTIEETRIFIGNGIKKLIERSLKKEVENFDDVFNTFKSHYKENCCNKTIPYDGVYDLLDYCKNNNIKIGVLSNKAQKPLEEVCNYYFKGYFDIIVGDRENLNKKPAIDGLVLVAKHYGINIEDILYIGDSEVDVKTVNNANCLGLFVSYGFRGRDVLDSCGATKIVDTPYEIINILDVK